MRVMLRILALTGIVVATLDSARAQAVLGADVIRQSFGGHTAEMIGQANAVFVHWAADGTQRMQNQRLGSDTGTWRVTPEGEFCGKWTKLRSGAESCAPVLDLGGGTYQWGNSKFRILPGNPKGL
jgi:hypothetical protein